MNLTEFERHLRAAARDIDRAEAQHEHEAVTGGHGSDYQRERQIYLRRLLNDPNQPAYVHGWVRQELRRLQRVQAAAQRGARGPGGDSSRLRGVPGFDVGHQPGHAGQHNAAWFRLEHPRSNRARPGIARRLGLGRKYFESEY